MKQSQREAIQAKAFSNAVRGLSAPRDAQAKALRGQRERREHTDPKTGPLAADAKSPTGAR